MNATLSLLLAVALTISPCLVTAQQRIDLASGSVSRASTREVARLAMELDAAQGGASPPMNAADWSRPRKLAPGTVISVTLTGSQAGTRYFLSADESGLVALDLTNAAIPPTVAAVLRKAASTRPDAFIAAQQSGTFVFEKNIRLDRDGVFVDGSRVVTLVQIVERIARSQVEELGVLVHEGHPIAKWVGVGLAIGLVAGLVWGRANEPRGGDDPGLQTIKGAVLGLGFGAAGGFVVGGIRTATSTGTTRVIYRAP